MNACKKPGPDIRPENWTRLRAIRHLALDMDGTIYRGGTLFPFTRCFLERMRGLGIGYTFLTNNPSKSSADSSSRVRAIKRLCAQMFKALMVLLAVSTAKRVSAIADVPTIAESGYPGYDSSIWFALFGPKQMDPAVVKAINDAVRQVLVQPAVRERFASRGNQVRIETPDQFRQTVRQNRQRWADVVKASGASID